jgi:mannose-6-phosphate isomerase-like protein (cupin superfamily)
MTIQTPMPKSVEAIPASRRWFLSLPTWIRASGAETNGTLSLIEQLIPAGFASPWHVHHHEDESFYVLDGKMTVVVGDRAFTLNGGDCGFGPRGIPHGFRIEGTKPAHILLMTNSSALAEFVRETSFPADTATPPEPNEADLPNVVAAAERYGLSILGPMPAP